MGCEDWPPKKMFAPKDVPIDTKSINPWIAALLLCDPNEASQKVKDRLQCENKVLAPLVKTMTEFVPYQIAFSSGVNQDGCVGHVRCVRRTLDKTTNKAVYDRLYLAQPLDDARLKVRLDYFDRAIRPLMSEFLIRFAGSGEEMISVAGHFTFNYCPTAEDFGYREEESLCDWKDSRLLYLACNGDGVFIKPNGSTAWRVLETDETVRIADTFEEFIRIYADFRLRDDVFDSHSWEIFMRTKESKTDKN